MATKWGIVSAGKISTDFTICLRSLPADEHKVVAVAARSLDSAQKFAATHNISKAYGSYTELSQDPEVEVVYIGSLNPQHLPIAKMMLEMGKHLLVEKPLTLNSKQTQELIALAQSKGLFLMEAIWSRFLPSYRSLMKQLEKGLIGDVYSVDANFGILIADMERVAKKELGGSAVLDIGVYTINVILMAFNGEKPSVIKAVGHLNANGVDESVSACFQFNGGKLASLNIHSKVQFKCEATITGTKGRITIPSPFWCSDKFTVTLLKEGGGDEVVTHTFPFPETVAPCVYQNSSGLRYQAIEVRRCLQEGLKESPLLTHNDSKLIAFIEDSLRGQVGAQFPEDL